MNVRQICEYPALYHQSSNGVENHIWKSIMMKDCVEKLSCRRETDCERLYWMYDDWRGCRRISLSHSWNQACWNAVWVTSPTEDSRCARCALTDITVNWTIAFRSAIIHGSVQGLMMVPLVPLSYVVAQPSKCCSPSSLAKNWHLWPRIDKLTGNCN
jgi:hypothetical protein